MQLPRFVFPCDALHSRAFLNKKMLLRTADAQATGEKQCVTAPIVKRRYPIGAELLGDGRTHFRVWAPKARADRRRAGGARRMTIRAAPSIRSPRKRMDISREPRQPAPAPSIGFESTPGNAAILIPRHARNRKVRIVPRVSSILPALSGPTRRWRGRENSLGRSFTKCTSAPSRPK